MTFYSFIGIAVTSATLIIFGEALWNPVAVLARLGNPFAVVLAMIALLMATLNVNVAANVVSRPTISPIFLRAASVSAPAASSLAPWALSCNRGN